MQEAGNVQEMETLAVCNPGSFRSSFSLAWIVNSQIPKVSQSTYRWPSLSPMFPLTLQLHS